MDKAKILADLKALVDAAKDENRSMTAEELAQFSALEADLARFNDTAGVNERFSRYIKPANLAIPDADEDEEEGVSAEVRKAFDSYLRTGHVSAELGAYKSFAMTEGTPSAGGYTVPDAIMRPMIETRKRFGGVAQYAEVITTTKGDPIPWLINDDTGNSSTVQIVPEGAAPTDGADIEFDRRALGAFKYVATGPSGDPIKVSVELLQDAGFDIAAYIEKKLDERIQRRMAHDFAVGTGIGQPQGINRIIPAVNLATGNAITYAKLLAVVHALDPEYREGARWLFNDAALAVVEGIVDTTGRPLLTPLASSGIAAGAPSQTLLGYPVSVDQAFPDVADVTTPAPGLIGEGFGVFGNIRDGYVVRYVRGTNVLVDPYTYGKNGFVAYHAWRRADGMIQDPNALVAIGGFPS